MDYKNQHYVPKCYLRPFSIGDNRCSINIYNINRSLIIEGAPIKSQCSSDYFYDRTGDVEQALQPIEGRFASITRNIDGANKHDIEFLKNFTLLQLLRTETAAKRMLVAQQGINDLIFEDAEEDTVPKAAGKRDFIKIALKTFSEALPTLSDLKSVLVVNETKLPFVASDDPAVYINRLYTQHFRGRFGNAGIANAGAMFILPLSRKYLVLSYDGDVYTCNSIVKDRVHVRNEREIDALNGLQCIKCNQNIYFDDASDAKYVRRVTENFRKYKPDNWHRIHYSVLDNRVSIGPNKIYRVVHTKEERKNSDESIIHVESVNINPRTWFSLVKVRSKPMFVDTGTAAGLKRRNMVSSRFA